MNKRQMSRDPNWAIKQYTYSWDDATNNIETYSEHHDTTGDGTNNCIIIYSTDYTIPLWGDYRGVELARINYNPNRKDSIEYAIELARQIIILQDERML